MKRGTKVRVVEGTPPAHAHPNDPDLLGLVGTVTGRSLQGMLEVRIPFPGTGKPFGFLLNPDQVVAVDSDEQWGRELGSIVQGLQERGLRG